MNIDEFEQTRAEKDPLRQAQRATELIDVYKNRSAELARLRKAAIDRAYAEGRSYTDIAKASGITKGRITQIRKSAPPVARAFFGVGPVTVAIPRRALDERPLGVIAAEDQAAADAMAELLVLLGHQPRSFEIPPSGEWEPPADAVAICGPKSSHVTAEAIQSDPYLSFEPDSEGRWVITDRQTGEVFVSPWDAVGDKTRDIAYVARLTRNDRQVIVVAGVHALGSIGAVEYLRSNLDDLFGIVNEQPFSLVVASTFDDLTVTETEALWGPKVHS
ncbi:hypothetical protein [Promicromonospora sp. NPDC019610]|uniref:hypothetical protein n=1 Tax=Promicromonospora sp. NPDC019610 TaxID=3364405 RepID=UPI0037BCB004